MERVAAEREGKRVRERRRKRRRGKRREEEEGVISL